MEGYHDEVSNLAGSEVRRLTFAERVLTAPYEERDGWELNIMCVNGVLYLEEHLTEARLQEKYDLRALIPVLVPI